MTRRALATNLLNISVASYQICLSRLGLKPKTFEKESWCRGEVLMMAALILFLWFTTSGVIVR